MNDDRERRRLAGSRRAGVVLSRVASGLGSVTVPRIVEQIAGSLGFGTLEPRNRDHLDFRDVSVGEIKRALCEAYQAGYDAAMQDLDKRERRGR